MWIMLTTLILLLSSLRFSSAIVGRWGELTESQLGKDAFAGYYKWRGIAGPNGTRNAADLSASFLAESPCRALTIRDNCVSHNPTRANALLRRKFEYGQGKVDPLVTISSIRNQYFLFAGDSVVLSVYQSLTCHLTQFANATYDYAWAYKDDVILFDSRRQDKCPGHWTCHLLGGKSYIAQYNITIAYLQVNKYVGRDKRTLHQMLLDKASRPTYLYTNFGAHYNDQRSHANDVQAFKRDMQQTAKNQRNAGYPITQVQWLETFPQHFPGGLGFYYAGANNTVHNNHTLRCEPLADKEKYHADDWRNRAIDTYMPELKREHRLVAVAEVLYDQWDAHLDYGDSLRVDYNYADCTHYCLGSGVFRFVVDRVLAHIVACINGNCRDADNK